MNNQQQMQVQGTLNHVMDTGDIDESSSNVRILEQDDNIVETLQENRPAFKNFYNLKDDRGFMKLATSALLNMPYSTERKLMPWTGALLQLINEQKASAVFGQYNYNERTPMMTEDLDSTDGIVTMPFLGISGKIAEPVCRLMARLKELERVKFRKAIIARDEEKLKKNILKMVRAKRDLVDEVSTSRLAKSTTKISRIFNEQSTERPELFYTDNSVYLRYLNPLNVMP